MRSAAGIIFSNIHDRNIPELTKKRTMASVPFGGRYRLIDFSLSNMVNADIYRVGIITHYNYQSLMDHLETGKDWDLNRSYGGIKFLPPFITAYNNTTTSIKPYSSRLEALMGAYNFINYCTEEYIVLSDSDIICNIDLQEVVDYHIDNGADITIVTKNIELTPENAKNCTLVESDKNDRITGLIHNPPISDGYADRCLNMFVIGKEYLRSIVVDSLARGYKSFTRDVITHEKDSRKFIKYEYNGYFASVNTIVGYYKSNMDLLIPEVRECLFGVKTRPVFTRVMNSFPTKYIKGSGVKNSLIADGCIIQGKVENSIISRGVNIGKNTVVKDSIIMGDTTIGDNVNLNCVISDRFAVIKNGRLLSGFETHPYIISRGSVI